MVAISKGVPLFDSVVRGESPPSGTKLPHKKLESSGYHMVKTRSLSHLLALNPYRVVTDRRTERQTDRQNSAVPAGTAVARKN